jgi:hypothetical protein
MRWCRSLKRQLDLRLRQLDRFEVSIKAATDSQKQWRLKLAAKQAELDAAKVSIRGSVSEQELELGLTSRSSTGCPGWCRSGSDNRRCQCCQYSSTNDPRDDCRTSTNSVPNATRKCRGQAGRSSCEGRCSRGEVGSEVEGARDEVEGGRREVEEGATRGEGTSGRVGRDYQVRPLPSLSELY